MNSKYQEYKKKLKKYKIKINDENVDLDDSIFIGCYFGIFIEDKLLFTFPYFSEKVYQMADYRKAVKEHFNGLGEVKRVALYKKTSTQQVFAIKKNKRVEFNLGIKDKDKDVIVNILNNPIFDVEINVHFCDQQYKDLFGVLKVIKKKITFMQMFVFNGDLITEDHRNAFVIISAYLGSGDYVEVDGVYKENGHMKYRIKKIPDHILLKEKLNVDSFEGYYEKFLKSLRNFRELRRLEEVFINNRFIKKSLFTGDRINYDWFGREFGFFILLKTGGVVRLYSESYSDKGIVHNMIGIG